MNKIRKIPNIYNLTCTKCGCKNVDWDIDLQATVCSDCGKILLKNAIKEDKGMFDGVFDKYIKGDLDSVGKLIKCDRCGETVENYSPQNELPPLCDCCRAIFFTTISPNDRIDEILRKYYHDFKPSLQDANYNGDDPGAEGVEGPAGNWTDMKKFVPATEALKKLEKLKKDISEKETIDHPAYYSNSKIEVIDFIDDKNLNFCLGNAIKYICRAGKKNKDTYVEDLKKAVWYIQHEIQRYSNDKTNN